MSQMPSDRDNLRRAVSWVSEQRKAEPGVPTAKLIEEASQKFDLGPLDAEFLWSALAGAGKESPGSAT